MPTLSKAARRVRKGDDATIPGVSDCEVTGGNAAKADGDMSDEGKKPWEKGDDDDKKPWEMGKGDDGDGDDDEDDDTSKGDGDDDDDEDDDDSAKKSGGFAADLKKAVRLLTRHGEQHDPALRKEALMAKELRGGGLSKSERGELVGILSGSTAAYGSAGRVARHQAPGPALRKSMVDNPAMAEAYDNITKSVHAQAEFLDQTAKSLEATNFAMARALVKACETITEVHGRQEHLAKAIEGLASQPAHMPRSVGLGWAEKSFGGEVGQASVSSKGGRLEKSSPRKIRQVLDAMAKSAGPRSAASQAYKAAADGLLMNRPLLPSVAAQVEAFMAEDAG